MKRDGGIDRTIDAAFPVWRYGADGWSAGEDAVAEEMPLTIRLDGEEFATIVCSPLDTEDLVYGFLAGEGIIATPDDVERIDWDDSAGFANVALRRRLAGAEADFGRRVIGSCCGRSRQFFFRSDVRTARTSLSRMRMRPEDCLAAMAELQRLSAAFARTGGVHNAALWAPGQGLVAMRTDIGRHNALDKLFGHCLRNGILTRDTAVIFSGRISSEVLLKTAKIGSAILIAKSAPTGLALRLAHDLGITTAGFVRGDRMNVYTHPERLWPNKRP